MPLLRRNIEHIRVAVAGLGQMGGHHVRALRQLAAGEAEAYYKSGLAAQVGKTRLCGVCDTAPGAAMRFPGLPFFHDWETLLRTVRPDIAVIATPTRTHETLALAALAQGVHVLVEKPVATRRQDWDRLAATADRHGVRLMSGHVERYNPVAIKLRTLLLAGSLRVGRYQFRRCQPHDPRIPDDIVTDKLIHDLDLAQFFFGPVAAAELLDFKTAGDQVQEAVVALRHTGGTSGQLLVSWLRPGDGKIRDVRMTAADDSAVTGDFAAKRLRIGGAEVDCNVPGWVKAGNNQIKDELADFIGYCLEPDPSLPPVQPLLTPAEIAAATTLIEQVAAAIASRKKVAWPNHEINSGRAAQASDRSDLSDTSDLSGRPPPCVNKSAKTHV